MHREILFINPGNHINTYQNLSGEYTAIDTPVWTALLANYLRDKGYNPAIYDVNVEGWDEYAVKEIINIYKPSLIIIMVYGHQPSASTQTMPAAGRIARDIKRYNRDIQVAMGGTHPSSLPERTLQEEDIDFVIQGEGAYTITGLLDYIKGEGKIEGIKGLWFKKGNKRGFTCHAPLIHNLDEELSGYTWDLLPDISNYRAHNWHCFQNYESSFKEDFSDVRSPYVSIYTSLGCPYSCSFCCINSQFGKPGIRYWSIDKVISWIDLLVSKYRVKNIRLADELFLLSRNRVELFCDMIIERNYELNIWVYGRVDTIEDTLLKKIKRAGINWIALGIESADREVMNGVNKRFNKDIKDVVRSIKNQDINVMGNYMFGLPEDNETTMEETLELAMDLDCEFVNFYTVMAYPGSKLYEDTAGKGDILPVNWEGFSQHSYETRPLSTKYLSAKEVVKFRDEAFSKYFTNPRYLSNMRNKFGYKVERHIEKMLDIKLRRKILED